jgi:hypothetical protein
MTRKPQIRRFAVTDLMRATESAVRQDSGPVAAGG